MTKEEFHKILIKPRSQCDGVDLHLRHLFENNSSKRIFALTGLDFSDMLKGEDTSGILLQTRRDYFRRETIITPPNI